MRKLMVLTLAALVVCLALAPAAFAKKPQPLPGPQVLKNFDGELFLFTKTPNSVNIEYPWVVNKPDTSGEYPYDLAWGKLAYHPWGDEFEFHFKAFNLVPGLNYSLIYYPDPWPGTGLQVLASGTAAVDPVTLNPGFLALSGSVNTGDLPTVDDANVINGGAKIWLVPTDMLGDGAFANWNNPERILFEAHFIIFDDLGDETVIPTP